MSRKSSSNRIVVVAAIVVLAPSLQAMPTAAADWPQWMGPERTGAVAVPGLFAGEGAVDLEPEWRRSLSPGYSSVTVANGRAFTLATGEEEDTLVAYDAGSGRELWRYRLDAVGIEKASSTPAVSDGRVFAINGRGKMHAVSTRDGAAVWSRDLRATLGAVPPSYGMATSPLLVDGLVVVLVGGRDDHNLVAFDQETGEIVWSVFHARRGSYASPAVMTIAGERQIVAPADDKLYAVRPDDGGLIWSHEGLGYLDRIPLHLSGDRLFVAQETRAVMLQVNRSEAGWDTEELWQTHDLKDSYSPAVHHQGSIYGFDGSFLTCLDAGTGERGWDREMSTGSLILVDGHLLVLEAFSGRLTVVAARPDKYVERAAVETVTRSANDGSYASPSYAGGRIFVRGGEEIVAIAVR